MPVKNLLQIDPSCTQKCFNSLHFCLIFLTSFNCVWRAKAQVATLDSSLPTLLEGKALADELKSKERSPFF